MKIFLLRSFFVGEYVWTRVLNLNHHIEILIWFNQIIRIVTILNYYRNLYCTYETFDRTREIETARFRIVGKNKISRFIERNREDRERIESRAKNLSIRFIDFIPLSFHIEIVARKRVTSFNRETDDSSPDLLFSFDGKRIKKKRKKRRRHKARPSSKRFYIVYIVLYIHICFSFCLHR